MPVLGRTLLFETPECKGFLALDQILCDLLSARLGAIHRCVYFDVIRAVRVHDLVLRLGLPQRSIFTRLLALF